MGGRRWIGDILLVVSGTKSLHVVSMLLLWDEQEFVHQILKAMHKYPTRSLLATGLV